MLFRSIEEQGLRLRALVKLGNQPSLFSYRTAPGKILNLLPGNTLALVSGQSPQDIWQNLEKQSQTNPDMQVVVEGAKRQVSQLKLDLNQDVLSWMTGEFALAALPNPPQKGGIFGSLGVAPVLLLDSSDPDRTNRALDQLDTLIQGKLSVAKEETAGKPVTYWRLPAGIFNRQTFLGHGWLTSNTLFVALGDAAIDSLVKPQGQPLSQTESFQTVVNTLPKTNGGYFYFKLSDLAQSANLAPIGGQFQRLPVETQAALESLQSVGITTSQPSENLNQVDVFLKFAPTSGTSSPAASPSPSVPPSPTPTP